MFYCVICRSANVLITAHTEELSETVMTATDEVEEDVGYDQAEVSGVVSKGYQQITSWQVGASMIAAVSPL